MKLLVGIACTATLLCALPFGVRAATVSYIPPAGNLPAGHYHAQTYNAVLPSGRLVIPDGTSVVTGMNSLGVTLTPDGRYAITTNDDEREGGVHSMLDPDATGGYSLTVVDTQNMAVASRYQETGTSFYAGIVAVRDPQRPAQTLVFAAGGPSNGVAVFDLDTFGRLTPDRRPSIAIPGPADDGFADRGTSFPGTLVASADGAHVYVVASGGGTVALIDTATRRLADAPRVAGFFPNGAALAGSQLLVSNEGLMRYGLRAVTTPVPSFDRMTADPQRASSLSVLPLDSSGGFAASPAQALPMDPAPDGFRLVGGAHPSAIAATADGAFAFVAMSNVDRVATVALRGTPKVVGGTELRLFDRGPYGTQPAALALSHDGSRLYVALSGLNAIAVIDARDPVHLHRLGLIPTGWQPAALALAADDRTLFVANQNGFGYDAGFAGDPIAGADNGAIWSTLERIDLAHVRLGDTTRAALGATRTVTTRSADPLPKALRNVIVIVEDGATYDDMLGDLNNGAGQSSFVRFGAAVTPNLHALAATYGVAGNFYADAQTSGAGAQQLVSGMNTAYTTRTAAIRNARRPLGYDNEDPEDESRLGTVFNELQRHALSFRDYGGFLATSGSAGGSAYSQNVPAPAVLAGHVDLTYPAGGADVSAQARAEEFTRDYAALAAIHRQPRYTYVRLPGSTAAGAPTAASAAAADAALGTIVAFVSRLPGWKTTAIVIVPGTSGDGRDHVDASRAYAVVVSPWAKHRYLGMEHLSGASVLKTVDRVFMLPPLTLGDLLANDMGDFFTQRPDFRPYTPLVGSGL